MVLHSSDTRGIADHGWLKSRHTFSFADYHDPERMGFGTLRVINDDFIEKGKGFGTHPHRDMEIITIPLEGTLRHKDSEGNSYEIRKGEVQIMSAGTGIAHSEYATSTEDVMLFQIWVLPKKRGVPPRYEQKKFDLHRAGTTLLVSPDGRDGSVTINQDAFFTYATLGEGEELAYQRQHTGNGLYILLVDGQLEVEGRTLTSRDGLGISDFDFVTFSASAPSEVLLMEVPMETVVS